MKVEILYLEGCPNYRPAVERVRQVLREEGLAAEVSEIKVSDEATAQALGFLGSPTVRIEGLDMDVEARSSRQYGMMCRTYVENGLRQGLPSKGLIRAAIREVATGEPRAHDCCHVSESGGTASSNERKSPGFLIAGSVVAAALASFCCILPIVFALTGVTVLGASVLFAAWRPYLLVITFGFLGLGFYFAYRPLTEHCDPGAACTVPRYRRSARMALWVATVAVIVLAAFPYFSAPVAEFLLSDGSTTTTPTQPKPTELENVSLMIDGMDCAACATAVENKLKTVRGVRNAKVSFERRVAEIQYESGTVTPAELERAVEEAGYRVRKKT